MNNWKSPLKNFAWWILTVEERARASPLKSKGFLWIRCQNSEPRTKEHIDNLAVVGITNTVWVRSPDHYSKNKLHIHPRKQKPYLALDIRMFILIIHRSFYCLSKIWYTVIRHCTLFSKSYFSFREDFHK